MAEPVSLEIVKVHLRLEAGDTDEDDYLKGLITAARRACEGRINRSVVGTPRVLELDAFPTGSEGWPISFPLEARPIDAATIVLPGGAVSGVSSITYRDGDGVTVTVNPATYITDFARLPGRVTPVGEWPAAGSPALIRINYTVSPLDADEAAVVAQAVLLLVEGWYSNRGGVVVGSIAAEIPLSVSWLLAPLRQFAAD